jgi:hypothetical protein
LDTKREARSNAWPITRERDEDARRRGLEKKKKTPKTLSVKKRKKENEPGEA